jgi:hypothetical protein
MALDARMVVVMSGRWHADYTDGSGFGPNSGPVLGYPTSEPLQVGSGLIVRLTGGEAGPGLMASDPSGSMRWLRAPIALRWLELNCPEGALGRPIGDQHEQPGGIGELQEFEHGSLRLPAETSALVGGGSVNDRNEAPPLSTTVRQFLGELYRDLHGGHDEAIVDDLQAAARDLGVPDIDEQASRIRHGLRQDPAQAVGAAKELLETVLKAILGLHGTGPDARKLDLPALRRQASIELGLEPGGVRAGELGAEQRRKSLGALATIVDQVATARNLGLGTGHGFSRRDEIDVATARLVVSAAVAAATFYIEAYAARRDAEN